MRAVGVGFTPSEGKENAELLRKRGFAEERMGESVLPRPVGSGAKRTLLSLSQTPCFGEGASDKSLRHDILVDEQDARTVGSWRLGLGSERDAEIGVGRGIDDPIGQARERDAVGAGGGVVELGVAFKVGEIDVVAALLYLGGEGVGVVAVAGERVAAAGGVGVGVGSVEKDGESPDGLGGVAPGIAELEVRNEADLRGRGRDILRLNIVGGRRAGGVCGRCGGRAASLDVGERVDAHGGGDEGPAPGVDVRAEPGRAGRVAGGEEENEREEKKRAEHGGEFREMRSWECGVRNEWQFNTEDHGGGHGERRERMRSPEVSGSRTGRVIALKQARPIRAGEIVAMAFGVAGLTLAALTIYLGCMVAYGRLGPDGSIGFAMYAVVSGGASLICFLLFGLIAAIVRLRLGLFLPTAGAWIAILVVSFLAGRDTTNRSRVTVLPKGAMAAEMGGIVLFADDSGLREAVNRGELRPNCPYAFVVGPDAITCLSESVRDGSSKGVGAAAQKFQIEIRSQTGDAGILCGSVVIDRMLKCLSGAAKQHLEEVKVAIESAPADQGS